MDSYKTIESRVFETVENAIKNDIRYKDYFIIVRSDNSYYVVGKDIITLNLILDKAVKNIFRFDNSELDYILPSLVRSGFRVAIIESEK
ncbi:MAG: MutS domain I [Bacteriophage sp.]|nr:MAG: MutS domain I [Bacteriophage sp.]